MAMAHLDRLRFKDLRAAYRLVGECCELGDDPRSWRLHMLEGLRQLTGAQVALCIRMDDPGTPAERLTDALDAGFLDTRERGLWGQYQQQKAYLDDPFHLGFFRDMRCALRTRRLASVVRPETWYRTRHYDDFVRACHLDDRITSALRLPGTGQDTQQVIVLHRSASDGKYERRHQQLVHLFHHELGTHLGGRLTIGGLDREAPELPFRLQQVLACLLEGDREKQVAARLALSPNTVNHHVQRLYRQYDVHSRGELMARCADMLPALARPE